MSQTKHQIQELLATIDAEPRKRFGQNFMIDQNLVRVVAEAGMISPRDVVIEVGPGTGTLTEELLARAGKVIAIEIDRDLAKLLRERFGANEKFELIEGDALAGKHELNEVMHTRITAVPRTARFKLVANLPYNIASPLVIEMLIAGVELLAFTVQKEVSDRLRASANDDAYGTLSVMASLLARVEILRTLPPQAFWPMPKIESALVRMTRENRLGERARQRREEFLDAEGRERNRARQREDLLRRRVLRIHGRIIQIARVEFRAAARQPPSRRRARRRAFMPSATRFANVSGHKHTSMSPSACPGLARA